MARRTSRQALWGSALILAIAVATAWLIHSHWTAPRTQPEDHDPGFASHTAATHAREHPSTVESSTRATATRTPWTQPAGDTPPRGQARIAVVDRDRNPVPGAIVDWVGATVLRLGVTSEGGTLFVDGSLPVSAGDCLVGRAAGYGAAELYLLQDQLDDTELVLPPGGSIVGRVRLTVGGIRAGEAITVVAVPTELLVGMSSRTPESLITDPRVRSSQCAQSGSFEIESVEAGRNYSVLAGGDGWVSSARPPRVLPGDDPVEIVVAPLFGAYLRFVTSENEPVVPHSLGVAGGGVSTALSGTGARYMIAPRLAALLAGTPAEYLRQEPGRETYLVTSDQQVNPAPTMNVSVNSPGFAPCTTVVSCERVGRGRGEATITLQRVESEWSWVDLSLEESTFSTTCTSGHATLRLESAQGEPYRLPVHVRNGVTQRLGPIPSGSYDWAIEWEPSILELPTDPTGSLALLPGATTRLAVRDEHRGRLLIVLRSSDGKPYAGPASFGLRRSEARPGESRWKRGASVAFSRAPYLIGGLPEIAVELTMSSPGRPLDGKPVQLLVHPNRTQEVQLVYAPGFPDESRAVTFSEAGTIQKQ